MFKCSRKCESDVCFFCQVVFLFFLVLKSGRFQITNHPAPLTETMTTTPQAFPAWWVAKVMSTPGDQMPTEKPLAPASRLVFVEFQKNRTKNRQMKQVLEPIISNRWWPDRKLGTCSAWIGGRRVLGSWSWGTRLVWHLRVICMST